jgi:hypothetical protein
MQKLTAAELRAVRDAATARFLDIAAAIKAEAGVVEHVVRRSLSGRAWVKSRKIAAPEGKTRRQLYVLAHECGHVALGHTRSKAVHVKELEAERWAHAALRRHGVKVPRKETVRAREYVGDKIERAKRSGAKVIDREAAAFAKA